MEPLEGLVLTKIVNHKKTEPLKAARILVADDSPDNRLLVQAYLIGSLYQLTFVEDGKAALDCFVASDFDLIVMDVHMPVMDHLAAALAIRELKRERGAPSVPILASSANVRSLTPSRHTGDGRIPSQPWNWSLSKGSASRCHLALRILLPPILRIVGRRFSKCLSSLPHQILRASPP